MASVSQPFGSPALSTFVKEVKNRLDSRGMTVVDLAKKAQVGRPYLHRVLAGEHEPTITWMEKVGKVLGIRIRVDVR